MIKTLPDWWYDLRRVRREFVCFVDGHDLTQKLEDESRSLARIDCLRCGKAKVFHSSWMQEKPEDTWREMTSKGAHR